MNKLATLLFVACFGLVTAGVTLLSPAAGLITAGVLAGAAGVLSLTVGPKRKKEPR